MRLATFVAVGASAAAVHLGVVIAIVETWQLAPLLANGIGWIVALFVSFGGHYRLTFRDAGAPLLQSARRFVAVSAAGFATNEIAYALLLRQALVRYDVALAIVLVAVAVATYLLSRRWAFIRA